MSSPIHVLIPDNTVVIFKHGFERPRAPAAGMKLEHDGAQATVIAYYDDGCYLIRFEDGHQMLAGYEELTVMGDTNK